MIPVLYDAFEKDFTTNGIGLLTDAVSCVVTEERNGTYELTLTYPEKGHLAKHITRDAIIKAKANDEDEPQLFRIYKAGKAIGSNTTWNAEHISYETNGNPVEKFTVSGVNAQRAMQELLDAAALPHSFTASSDITTTNSTSIDGVVSVRNALGGTTGSILDVWGGEYHFDNFRIELLKARGADNGVTIEYGKNLISAKQEENIADVVTAIFPWAKYKAEGAEEETYISLPEKTLIHENASAYANIKCEIVDFSKEWESGTIITADMLREKATEYLNKLSTEPKISITLSFASLKKTKDYKNMKALESVKLCDTVTVKIEKLGINVTAKITKAKYDSIKERYDSVEIGDTRTNLTKSMTAAQKEIQELVVRNQTRAEQIKAQIEQTIKDVTAAITGNSGGYVVLHPEKNPQEIFIMDTPDTATAKNVWRWNLAGLGHSSTGINGKFTTAITADGQIVADFITAGELTGAILKAGTVYAEALDVEYRNSVTKYADDAASGAVKEAKEYADNLQKSTDKEIEDVNKAVDDINNALETTVADGIITESEKAAIQKILQIIEKEKKEADAKYNEIYGNSYLTGTPKTNLKSAYNTAYGTASTSKYNKLVTAVNAVINATTAAAVTQKMEAYRTAYTEYGAAVAAYQTAVEAATDAIANAYAVEKAEQMGETVTQEMTSLIETTAEEIRLLCKTIEEYNMHNYVVGGDFADGFTEEWYTNNSTNNYVVTDATLGKCVRILKSSSTYSYIRCKLGVLPAGTYRVRYKAATAPGYESTARVQCTMVSISTTPAGLLKSTEFTTVEREVTITASTSVKYLYFYATVQGAPVYIKDVEVLGQMRIYTEAQLKVNADAITAEVTRAKNEEEELKASIKVNADAIKLKVSSADVESLIEQKADSIRLKAGKISWESTYSSMTSSGTLTCQNATIKGTLYSENGDDKVYLRNGRMQIWYNDVELGMIGGNGFEGYSDKEGLSFDLEDSGDYMTWAAQDAGGGTYKTKWTYARSAFASYSAGMLNAGCDIDMHNYDIHNVWLDNIVAPNGYKGWTGEIPIVTRIENNSNGGITWYTSSITVSNGIITSAPRS